MVVVCATTAMALPAQTFTTLCSFGAADGGPDGALVQSTDGNLYGTTPFGGANDHGTIFKITPSGALTTLYSFCRQSGCPDGDEPTAALVQAANGEFYGTTYGNVGTIFKIAPSGTVTTLYSFCHRRDCRDGELPAAALVQAADGELYGTTEFGGANNGGTVFKISSGMLTTLYSFCSQRGCTDGESPLAGLVQADNGDFYGTTSSGGANACLINGNMSGCGTVFKITPSGTLTTLYSFCPQSGCLDGDNPVAGLVKATNGDLYGTTFTGGANGGGTIFKITPSGTLKTLYAFCSQSNCADGAYPVAGVIQATDGDFYGTTFGGGANPGVPGGPGTVFRVTLAGTLTTLYSFCSKSGCADGDLPAAALVQATDGNFYGATQYGGASAYAGTVFSLSTGLGPFVKAQPAAGAAGKAVEILGSNLSGATGVAFNGTAASFTVVSRTLITTTVPVGATTGKVEVTTPEGMLSTRNVNFRVLP